MLITPVKMGISTFFPVENPVDNVNNFFEKITLVYIIFLKNHYFSLISLKNFLPY